jgi:NADPH-dependent ferric siderophore reductase
VTTGTERIRREPPRFRHVTVRSTMPVTPRLMRVTLTGDELDGFAIEAPAASVRLLLPEDGARALVVPEWNGNEFLLPDGRRPTIRTFTPLRFDPAGRALDVEIVMHGGGAASAWATAVQPGAPAAISGPGRGYVIDHHAPAYMLAGDETAIPAMSQLLDVLPHQVPVRVLVEIAGPEARCELSTHPRAEVTWCELASDAPAGDALFEAVRAAAIGPDARVWVAGEAAAVQRIRRLLFEHRGLTRSQATVRGYWKLGRRGDD